MRIVFLCLCVAFVGCKTLENAAARDPMKCERDATCAKKRSKSFDCSTQCADDPTCIDRCTQVEYQTGAAQR